MPPVLVGVADGAGQDPPEPGGPALHRACLEFVEVEHARRRSAAPSGFMFRYHTVPRGDVGVLGLLQQVACIPRAPSAMGRISLAELRLRSEMMNCDIRGSSRDLM